MTSLTFASMFKAISCSVLYALYDPYLHYNNLSIYATLT